jgi:uncharacterized protein (TIGR02001 family)
MKKAHLFITLSTILSTTSFLSTQTFAAEGLSANVGVTNNYLWRSLEQTNGTAAVSGGIDYETASGFYIGSWVSDANWSEGMTYELDIYGGYTAELENFSYDVGFVHYAYPDSSANVDFTEVNAAVTFGAFTFAYAVLADAEGVDFGDDSYISVDAEFELATEIALALHIGSGTDNFYAGETFIEYGASISKNNFSFGVSKNDLTNSDIKFIVSYSVDIDL